MKCTLKLIIGPQAEILKKSVEWQFKVDDARTKLKHPYPVIITD